MKLNKRDLVARLAAWHDCIYQVAEVHSLGVPNVKYIGAFTKDEKYAYVGYASGTAKGAMTSLLKKYFSNVISYEGEKPFKIDKNLAKLVSEKMIKADSCKALDLQLAIRGV